MTESVSNLVKFPFSLFTSVARHPVFTFIVTNEVFYTNTNTAHIGCWTVHHQVWHHRLHKSHHHTAGQQTALGAAGHSGKYLQKVAETSGLEHLWYRHGRPCYMCTVTALYHTSAEWLVLYHTTTYGRSCWTALVGTSKLTHRQAWYERLLTKIFSSRTNDSRLEAFGCKIQ